MVAAVGFTREGGREGTHPGALHGILQGTHPLVLGVYQGTLYVVLHTLYTSRRKRHSYIQLYLENIKAAKHLV